MIRRVLSAALVLIYFSTNSAFAYVQETGFWEERRIQAKSVIRRGGSTPNRWLGPRLRKGDGLNLSSFGTLRGHSPIIHIQDIHQNLEAQTNIGNAIEELIKNKQVDLIALEGAFEPIDLSAYQEFPDQDSVHKVADYLLRENKISGPIHAAMTTSTKVQVIGIDDKTHYDRNVAAVKTALTEAPELKKDLADEKNRLEIKKADVFNRRLKEFDVVVERYRKSDLTFADYAKHLNRHSGESRNDGLTAFLTALTIEESLDFQRVETERTQLIRRLAEKINDRDKNILLDLSSAFQNGRLNHAEFYETLKNLCANNGVSLRRYPAMESYVRYVLLSQTIDGEKLLAETNTLEKEVYASLTTTEEETALVLQSRQFYLTGKLLDLALTKEEWGEYKTVVCTKKGIQFFEDFYKEAQIRDIKMAENLQAAIKKYNAKKVVFVTGGFHTISLKNQAIATFVPKLTKIDTADGSAYLNVFSQEKTPLEKLFEGEKLFLATSPLGSGVRLRATAWLIALGAQAGIAFEALQKCLTQTMPGWALRNVSTLVSPVQLQAQTTNGRLLSMNVNPVTGDIVPALLAVTPTVAEEVLRWAVISSFGLQGAVIFMSVHAFVHFYTDIYAARGDHLSWSKFLLLNLPARFLLSAVFSLPYLTRLDSQHSFFLATILHSLTTLVLHKQLGWNSLRMSVVPNGELLWWQDPSKVHVAETLPITALRADKETNDPGIGKLTYLAKFARNKLTRQGVNVALLMPFFAQADAATDESPYAPACLYAINELLIDWSKVPEVRKNQRLSSLLKVEPHKAEVDYAGVQARERVVAMAAYEDFIRQEHRSPSDRGKDFQRFCRTHDAKLTPYANFMALHEILRKSSVYWTANEVTVVQRMAEYKRLREMHLYAQWNAYGQLETALKEMHDAGIKVLFDIPMFRGKDSVDVWKQPELFRDLKTRSAGLHTAWTSQEWGDLALWNWGELEKRDFDPLLDPFRHWLDLGFDGARNDALHFAYPIGQNGDNDEPGDRYVSKLAAEFHKRGAFPVAEAFENKTANVAAQGMATIDNEWVRFSTHDDPERWYTEHPTRGDLSPVNFLILFGEWWRRALSAPIPGRSTFLSFTLGDLEGDHRLIKRHKNGKTRWRYRLPFEFIKPRYDLGHSIRLRTQIYPRLREAERFVWDDPDALEALREMFIAANDSFVKHRNETVEIWAASRDWFFEQWGRDTFIALPGVLLATGRFAAAKEVIRSFGRMEKKGLIPNRVADSSHPEWNEYNTIDGPMWFIQAVKKYVEYTGDWDFAWEMAPAIQNVIRGYEHGAAYDIHKHISEREEDNVNRIWMDPADGLIVGPGQATWMDADPEGTGAITPRHGKAVEINALWYANLRFLIELQAKLDLPFDPGPYYGLADKVRHNFNTKFWNHQENALYDVIEGDPHGKAIRPNMLVAVSHGLDLLSPERQEAVLRCVEQNLLTPFGPRTLDPRDSHYRGYYNTWEEPEQKDSAYHQGTVWPWLMGPYIDTLVKVRKGQNAAADMIKREIEGKLQPLVQAFIEHGSLHEAYDGHPREHGRQLPGGASSQAWSVGEVFRVLMEHGVLQPARHAPDNIPSFNPALLLWPVPVFGALAYSTGDPIWGITSAAFMAAGAFQNGRRRDGKKGKGKASIDHPKQSATADIFDEIVRSCKFRPHLERTMLGMSSRNKEILFIRPSHLLTMILASNKKMKRRGKQHGYRDEDISAHERVEISYRLEPAIEEYRAVQAALKQAAFDEKIRLKKKLYDESLGHIREGNHSQAVSLLMQAAAILERPDQLTFDIWRTLARIHTELDRQNSVSIDQTLGVLEHASIQIHAWQPQLEKSGVDSYEGTLLFERAKMIAARGKTFEAIRVLSGDDYGIRINPVLAGRPDALEAWDRLQRMADGFVASFPDDEDRLTGELNTVGTNFRALNVYRQLIYIRLLNNQAADEPLRAAFTLADKIGPLTSLQYMRHTLDVLSAADTIQRAYAAKKHEEVLPLIDRFLKERTSFSHPFTDRFSLYRHRILLRKNVTEKNVHEIDKAFYLAQRIYKSGDSPLADFIEAALLLARIQLFYGYPEDALYVLKERFNPFPYEPLRDQLETYLLIIQANVALGHNRSVRHIVEIALTRFPESGELKRWWAATNSHQGGAAWLGFHGYLKMAAFTETALARMIVPAFVYIGLSSTTLGSTSTFIITVLSIPSVFWGLHVLRGFKALASPDVLYMTALTSAASALLLLAAWNPWVGVVLYLITLVPVTLTQHILDYYLFHVHSVHFEKEAPTRLTPDEQARLTPRYASLNDFLGQHGSLEAWKTAHPHSTLVHFLRHGEAASNILTEPQTDKTFSPLTRRGLRQRHVFFQLVRRLNLRFDWYGSSSLERAYQTMQPLARWSGKEHHVLPALQEFGPMPFGGIPYFRVREFYAQLADQLDADPLTYAPLGQSFGQRREELHDLFGSFLQNPGTYMLATHGRTLQWSMMSMLGISPAKYRAVLNQLGDVSNLSTTLLEHDSATQQWNVLVYDDNSYLPERLKSKTKDPFFIVIERTAFYLKAFGRLAYRAVGGRTLEGVTDQWPQRHQIIPLTKNRLHKIMASHRQRMLPAPTPEQPDGAYGNEEFADDVTRRVLSRGTDLKLRDAMMKPMPDGNREIKIIEISDADQIKSTVTNAKFWQQSQQKRQHDVVFVVNTNLMAGVQQIVQTLAFVEGQTAFVTAGEILVVEQTLEEAHAHGLSARGISASVALFATTKRWTTTLPDYVVALIHYFVEGERVTIETLINSAMAAGDDA